MKTRIEKIGLALGSGGARGLVHIGVLRAFEKHGIRITHIAGTSIGACIGAMYAAGQKSADIQDKVLNDKWIAARCFFDPAFLKGGILEGKKLEALLIRWIGKRRFGDLEIPFATVSTDLITGKAVEQQSGNLIKAVRASMSIPSLFSPIGFQKKLLVDGGLVAPVPVLATKNLGANTVIAVNLDHKNNIQDPHKSYRFTNNVLLRTVRILRHHLADISSKDANIVIAPKIDPSGLISISSYLNKNNALELIKKGFSETNRALKKAGIPH